MYAPPQSQGSIESEPRVFRAKELLRLWINCCKSTVLSPVMIMSSTYIQGTKFSKFRPRSIRYIHRNFDYTDFSLTPKI